MSPAMTVGVEFLLSYVKARSVSGLFCFVFEGLASRFTRPFSSLLNILVAALRSERLEKRLEVHLLDI